MSIGQDVGAPAGAVHPQDFFAMFEVAPGLLLDTEAVRRRYLERVRQLHPDLYGDAGPEEREMRLGMTAHLNDGWRALSRLDARAETLVRLYRPGEDAAAPVPPEVLGEAFELGEAVDDARRADPSARADALGRVHQRLVTWRAAAERDLVDLGGRWDALGEPPSGAAELTAEHRQVLDAVRGVLGRLKVVDRLAREVEAARTGEPER